MNYRVILEQVQTYIQSLYKTQSKPWLFYHNITHVEYTVWAATQIANHYQLNDRDFFIVLAAAWFHDIGYFDNFKDHEERGASKAEEYLNTLQIDKSVIKAVKGCIMATKMPQRPNGLLEQIICDADLFHLGTDDFTENNKRLRKEYNAVHNVNISKEEWRAKTVKLLQVHQYHTEYCRKLLNAKKAENLAQLLAKDEKNPNLGTEETAAQLPEAVVENSKKKSDRPDRGIETMFRISSSNHQRLSDMADNKSHILITVNSIIISAVATLLLRKLDTNDYFTIPAIMLLLVSLSTIVIAILATRPQIPNGTFTQEQIEQKNVNLLFFGNFYHMDLNSYANGMKQVMNDRDFLYNSLIRDIYSQGVVLGKKYKLLRAAYNIFMFGLIASIFAFIVAALLVPKV